jgi:hypothetical protein
VAALLFGAVNQPELRSQVEEILRAAAERRPKP